MGFDFEKALSPLATQQGEEGNGGNAPAATAAPAEGQQQNQPPQGGEGSQQQPNQQSQSQAPAPGQQTQQSPQFDVNNYFDRMSNGFIKDEEGFKAVLPHLQEYPQLRQRLDELQGQLEKAPKFFDDEVRMYNDLKAGGATPEQLRNFQKINQLGDVKELSDTDALIARMVLVDGVKESVAKMKVEREFKLNDQDIVGEDRDILNEDQRVAANKAREELTKYKADVSKTSVPSPEEQQLQLAARTQEHTARVVPYVKDLVTGIPHMGKYELVAADKDGNGGISIDIPIDDTSKAEIAGYVQNYLLDGLMEINEQNTLVALQYARAEYFRTHDKEIFKSIADYLTPLIEERAISRFENQTGLKVSRDNPAASLAGTASETAQFMSDVAHRRRG